MKFLAQERYDLFPALPDRVFQMVDLPQRVTVKEDLGDGFRS